MTKCTLKHQIYFGYTIFSMFNIIAPKAIAESATFGAQKPQLVQQSVNANITFFIVKIAFEFEVPIALYLVFIRGFPPQNGQNTLNKFTLQALDIVRC